MERVPLNDGALSLAEALSSISAGGVREVDGRTDLDVIAVCGGINKISQIAQSLWSSEMFVCR